MVFHTRSWIVYQYPIIFCRYDCGYNQTGYWFRPADNPSNLGKNLFSSWSGRTLHTNRWVWFTRNLARSGPVFCLLLRLSSDYAQPITSHVTEVTCPVIGQAQPELTPSKREKTGPGLKIVLCLGAHLLTLINFNLNMEKWLHAQ